MELIEITQVKEVIAGLTSRDSLVATRTVNEMLAAGWVLLAIQGRAEVDGAGGEHKTTAYILGRKD